MRKRSPLLLVTLMVSTLHDFIFFAQRICPRRNKHCLRSRVQPPVHPQPLSIRMTYRVSGCRIARRPGSVLWSDYWIYELTQEEPPMTAWGLAQYKAAKSSFGTRAVPIAETNDLHFITQRLFLPPDFPRAPTFSRTFPIQIVQSPTEVIVLFEWDSLRHQIFTDGRAHDNALGSSVDGRLGRTLGRKHAGRGHGEFLTKKTWLDRIGHPHSDALHVIEHIRRIDRDHLEDEITIDDPKAYTKPWSGKIVFALKPKWTLSEEFCEDISSFENIEEQETTPPEVRSLGLDISILTGEYFSQLSTGRLNARFSSV